MNAGVIVLVAVLVAATSFGVVWRSRAGRLRSRGSRGQDRLTAADLGEPIGRRATLVQFSTAVCAPCRETRRLLAGIADATDGVAHVEIDAAARPDLVRRLGIYATPAVFVLGPDGRIARRASGQPRRADVMAALGELLPAGAGGSPPPARQGTEGAEGTSP
jgi:thiol-disulfide isomerase/thioredoxin